MNYDCIIVGGGPAGATAARTLAVNGLSVVLLEKARFPRVKPCGGGLTTKSVNEIQMDIDCLVLNTSRSVRAIISPSRRTVLMTKQTLARFVDRSRFDQFLLQEAERQGAEIRQGSVVTGIKYRDKRFLVHTLEGVYRSSFLVGADGAGSIVNSHFGIVRGSERGKALCVTAPEERFRHMPSMTFDFTAIPGGYGWVFPGTDTVSVGLYTTDPHLGGMASMMDLFLDSMGCSDHRDLKRYGSILPFWGVNYRQPSVPVVLTGDAAGFVDPLSGEGISYAIRSAKIAADCIHAWKSRGRFKPGELQTRYEKRIIRVLKTGGRLAGILYGRRAPFYQCLTSGPGLRIFFLVFLKGDDYPDLLKKMPAYLGKGSVFRVKRPSETG